MAAGSSVILSLTCAAALYWISNVLYRCFFSPLAKIPGPRLAAATGWYESYYDFFKEGQWMTQINKLHDQYGPIVRINPREVHVRDTSFSDQLYVSKYNKDRVWLMSLGQDVLSAASTLDHATHRARRGALNPFFTRAGISKRIDTLQTTISKLCDRLEQAQEDGSVVCFDDAFTAASLDIIALFCYGKDYGYLDRSDFGLEWRLMMRLVFASPALMRAFPFMGAIMKMIPTSIVKKLNPALNGILTLQEDCERQIKDIMNDEKAALREPQNVFEQILASDLPASDKQFDRLVPEGISIIAAGSDTTAKALTITMFHLLKNPKIIDHVRTEIGSASGPKSTPMVWTQLEQLPWLTAVVREGCRVAGSITGRSPRVISNDIMFEGHRIPAGTVVSQTINMLLNDPSIFPEPSAFRPERWLKHESDGSVSIDKSMNGHMVAWAKGPRSCLGMWLAQAEMYLVIAELLSRFDFELFETSERDVRMAMDRFLPYPVDGSNGVRVKVLSR